MADREAKLIIYDGAKIQGELPLRKTQTLMGRASDNDIILNDRLASRLHAIIEEQDGVYMLRDNNSRNGTLLNGQKVIESRLKPGDQIKIGNTVIEFIVEGEVPVSVPSPAAPEDYELGWKRKDHAKKSKRWRPSRALIVTLVIITVVLSALAAFKHFIQPPPQIIKPLPLPYEYEVGYIPDGDMKHEDKVIYTFEGSKEPLNLYFKVWDIDDDDELDIFLNGQKIADVANTGSGNWSGERSLYLPPELIREGNNQLVFDNPRNPPNKELWAVSNVRVEVKQDFTCDQTTAASAFQLGKSTYEARKIVPRNLYESIKRLQLCLNYLQNCPDKPSYYMEAVSILEAAQAELKEDLRVHFFQATKFSRLKQFDKAEQELRMILMMVPDSSEEDHLKAKRELSRLGEKRTRSGK